MKRFSRTQINSELEQLNTSLTNEQQLETGNTLELKLSPQKLRLQQQVGGKVIKQSENERNQSIKFAFLMMDRLMKSKKQKNLEYSINKIVHRNQKSMANKNRLLRILRISQKFEKGFKQFALSHLKMNHVKCTFKIKVSSFLKSICTGFDRKLKSAAFLNILNFCNKTVCEQNRFLKEFEAKYEENNIPQQYAKQLRKFIRINPRNIKNFMKSSQDIGEPVIYALVEVLEQKRIKKSIQSNSQILVGITKNYVETLKDVNGKMICMENQVKDIRKSKNEIETQLKDLTKESETKMKEIKKYDLDLVQKSDSVTVTNFSAQSLKNFERVIDNQIKICEGKTYNGYEYSSRAAILKSTSVIVKRFLDHLQIPVDQTNHSKRNLNKHLFTTKKNNEIIEQQNSIQQSDIVEEITNIVNDLVAEMRKQTSFEELKACLNEKKFSSSKKPMQTPQLMNIYRKFQQILAMFCESKFVSFQIQIQNNELKEKLNEQNRKLSHSLKQKTDNVLSLNEKINEMQLSLRKINADKVSSMSSFEKQVTKRQKQLEEAIEGLSIKLQESFIEIQAKDKQIDILTLRNLQKERKLGEVKNEFKSFKKTMKNSMLKNKEREKSIDEILERSLSKSKISVNSGIFNKTFDSTARKEKRTVDGAKQSKLFLNSPDYVSESVLEQLSIDLSEKDDGKRNSLILGPIKRTSSIKNLKNILGHQVDSKNMNKREIKREEAVFMKPREEEAELINKQKDCMARSTDRNLDDIYSKKMNAVIETNNDGCNQTPKRQSRQSSKNKPQFHELNKTIKQISSRKG